MNDLYNETVVRNGKTYHYDPDMDIYYCRHDPKDHTHWYNYGWIYVIVLLTVVCAIATS